MHRAWVSPILLLVAGDGFSLCEVDVNAVRFGILPDLEINSAEGEGGVFVDCAEPTQVRIALNAGLSPDASNVPRLSGNGSFIRYRLFLDSTKTQIWGNGLSGTYDALAPSGMSLVIYGEVPAGQQAKPGEYSDSIEVTVEW